MNVVFVSLRVLHVLLGAAWLGGAVLLSFFLMPAIKEVGPDGGKVVVALIGRRLDAYIASIAGLTVLTGFYLYWVVTGGFDSVASASLRGRVLGVGGVLGLAAAIIGGSVVARSMKKAVALMTQAAGTTDSTVKSTLMAQAVQCRQKAATGGRLVAFLLIVTIVLMVIGGHFA